MDVCVCWQSSSVLLAVIWDISCGAFFFTWCFKKTWKNLQFVVYLCSHRVIIATAFRKQLAVSTVRSVKAKIHYTSLIIIIIIILRRFLTRRNTTRVITRARINAKGDDMSQRQKISYERSVMVRRYDFNTTLKLSIDCLARMCCGSRFHSDGAATANDRAPNFVAVLAMRRSSRDADRRSVHRKLIPWLCRRNA